MSKLFDEERLAKIWVEYKEKPTPMLLATLVNSYSPIVRKIAASFMHKKPNTIDWEDLYQAGNLGLLDAIEKYDPSRGFLFQTYATIRVRGAILDEINYHDWTPRSVRENIKGVLKSIEKHRENEQSEPTIQDIADDNNITTDETRNILSQMNRTYMVHTEHETFDLIAQPTSVTDQTEISIAIKFVLEKYMTPEERKFVELKFFGGYSNKEIANMMKISSNNLRTIKESAVRKLTKELLEYKDSFNS